MPRCRALGIAAVVLSAALPGAACESSFDKADRIRAEAGDVAQAEALQMRQTDGIEAEAVALIPDAEGTMVAAVIAVRSTGEAGALWAPIEVELLDAGGSVVGTNNIPGALPVLVHLPSLMSGETTYYVNDQIIVSAPPHSARITVGGAPVRDVPEPLATSDPVISDDELIGRLWSTTVTNTTSVRQEQLIVQILVRRGDEIVGAGTSIIDGLDPGQSAEATGAFIGSWEGDYEILAPASNGPDGAGAEPVAPDEADDDAMTLQIG